MTTLKDVAKKANVSLSTVSYALNDSSRITEATKEKVRKAAQELGYVPNGVAKSLKRQKSEIISLFISGYKGPVFGQLIQGIQDVVNEKGYELIVNASYNEHRLLKEKHFDGALVLNHRIDDELVHEVASSQMPLVALDRFTVENPYISSVLIDNTQGISLAMEYLMQKKFTKIGFAGRNTTGLDGLERFDAYKGMLRKYDLPLVDNFVYDGHYEKEAAYNELDTVIKNGVEVPEAIVCANDEMALGIIDALIENGYRVPNDVSIIGFDDIQLAKWGDTGLSTIRVPLYEWGRSAAQALFLKLEGNEAVTHKRMPVELIKRNSG
ncbi:LacI family DNA-binding transcriptional regulator [Bacillus sp. JJ722]|uniref:LacI family DNA-binding transcriptional regulator n=1 Tax=Bacillus sp. JJ722 TaxID=3122973 RepID=UPI002FFDB007